MAGDSLHSDGRREISRREFLRWAGAIGVGASAAGLLGACAKQSPASPTSAPAGKPAATSAPAKKVTLNLLVRSSGLFDKIEALTPQFTEETGIEVVYTKLPEDQLYDRIALVGASGNNPFDVTATGHFGAKQYGMAGYFEQLPMPADKDEFIPSTLTAWMVGDTLYGWPLITDTNVYFYRKDLFEKYGISAPPATWDEFREVALRLTLDKDGRSVADGNFDADNVQTWGAIFKGAQNNASSGEFFNWLQQAGGSVLDQDYKIAINKPPAVHALQFLTDLLRRDKVMPASVSGFGYNEFVSFYVQGSAAQAVNWVYQYASSNNPDSSKIVGQTGIALLPKEEKRSSMIGGWSWNMFKSSANKDAAAKFIEYFTSADIGWYLATNNDSPPVRQALFDRLIKEKGEPWQTLAEQLKYAEAQTHLETGQSTAIESSIQEAIQLSLIGQKTPQEALDDCALAIQDILDKAGFKP